MNEEKILSNNEQHIVDILKKQGVLNDGTITKTLQKITNTNTTFLEELLNRAIISQDSLNHAYALHFNMDVYNDIPNITVPANVFAKIPYSFTQKNTLLPIRYDDDTLVVAVADPLHLEALEDLTVMLSCDVKAVYCNKNTITTAIEERYKHDNTAASELLDDLKNHSEIINDLDDTEAYDLLATNAQAPIIKLLNLILSEAINQEASDIHFEPSEKGLKVRYRIDGILQNRHTPPQKYQTQLLTRIKVMAKLDIAERRLPQDGRIKLRMGGRDIDFRVSTAPTINGERIVLRILHKGNVVLGIDNIGMDDTIIDTFKKIISIPEGIILVTGPTGSGKTTTLYSALCEIYTDETNIMTIEDPVEYKIPGISQIAVKPKIGLDFAAGLRHILRQDPDIIMVGEIRDKEPADIAIQSALTGHLVISTLHTNDAPSAITRLVDMAIEPYLLSSTLVGIVAQRLVRCICPECKAPYNPTPQELSDIGLDIKDLDNGVLFRGKGCPECYESGYKGRHGVYELMLVDDTIKKQIIQSADAGALKDLALQHGMRSLRQHGAKLVAKGITTVTEILRVSRGV